MRTIILCLALVLASCGTLPPEPADKGTGCAGVTNAVACR
jgi:hypothetical protein